MNYEIIKVHLHLDKYLANGLNKVNEGCGWMDWGKDNLNSHLVD